MQEDKTIIGTSNSHHRLVHSFITIPFLAFEGFTFYMFYTSSNPNIKGWVIAFTIVAISVPYFILLKRLTRSLLEMVIIDECNLTLIHRTPLLTIPIQKGLIPLWQIASIYQDDDHLYLYDKQNKLLLKISNEAIEETKEIVDELQKRLTDIKYTQYSSISNVTYTYQMSNSSIIILVVLLAIVGVFIWHRREFLDNVLFYGLTWGMSLWYLIYHSSLKVVIKHDQLTYKGRTFFFVPFEKTINVSDIASMDGNSFEIWLYDKDSNKLLEIRKNIFYFEKLTRALEILISKNESKPEASTPSAEDVKE
ncbi:MAG: hypothetical protein KBT27_05140 [Prevotellaceae bacterium]|nr:hypothetical protein [Candidatus Faecinaster equi]